MHGIGVFPLVHPLGTMKKPLMMWEIQLLKLNFHI
ncbi:hypothetical protein BOMU111920_13735 [Bordetella muralis]